METFQRPELKERSPDNKDADKAALQALAQAAVNVELFTIPLYMVSLYSIQGMHQITSAGNDFYQGRLWPGAAPSRDPEGDPRNSSNALAFNHCFSVFIDEMLHLQLASNIAKALGVMPSYNSSMLQDANYGWTCYADTTVIPHILDFQDCIPPYNEIKVKLDALTLEQNQLFLAIEQNDEDAKSMIDPQKAGRYFPAVPFAGWSSDNTEADLPMFGTIGWMYKCLWQYMEIEYTDGTSLFEYVFNRGTLERDLFNASSSYHRPEYPEMRTMASGEINVRSAMENILNMINAITDQGEGQGVAEWIMRMRGLLQYAPVEGQFRPDEAALDFDYPNYTDTGNPDNPSGQTVARSRNGALDHHDRFSAVRDLLQAGQIVTWDQWHAAGNQWTAEMLKTTGYELNKWPLPSAEEIAAALNNLKGGSGTYATFSQAAAGSIAGITRVLSDFWTDETSAFPSPSMYGSGDRVSICWAVFGKFPDITQGIADKTPGVLYHACQGLDLNDPGKNMDCAQVQVFHSCRGSNGCKAEGGCGFVQVVGQSALCGHKVLLEHLNPTQSLGGGPHIYSAPSDNKCATFGGCAIPVSASQLYPPPQPDQTSGGMEVIDFVGQTATPEKIGNLQYKVGEKVFDVAWEAFIRVLEHRGVTPPQKPADSDLRIALPPST